MDSDASLYAALKKFGISEFRGQQKECIKAILRKEDVFVLWPTGAGMFSFFFLLQKFQYDLHLQGKSLVYQVPAVVTQKLSIVISPLISLMFDQVQHLVSHGIFADVICSAKTKSQNAKVCFHF